MRCNTHNRRAGAFTLAEAVISIAVVGLMLVAALNAAGMSRMSEYRYGERARGLLLADALMSEIMQQPYVDPDTSSDVFGSAAEEAATGNRSLFDDVDDYDDWSSTPPQQRDGTVLTGYEGWTRSVEVAWVDWVNLSDKRTSDTGVKGITVRVAHKGREVASLYALCGSAGP